MLVDHVRKHHSTLPLIEELAPAVQPEGSELPVEIVDILERLPPPQGKLLALVYGYGFTHAEAAQILGTTPAAVKTAVWRARESFRAAYADTRERTGVRSADDRT